MHLRLALLVSSLSMVSALACGGGDLVLPSDGGPAQVRVVHGDQQQAAVSQEVADSLVVQVVDTAGQGVADRTVTWNVSAGGGRVDPATSTTDANGFAWSRWTLGPDAGDNTVTAAVSGAGFATFTAVATSDDGGGGGGGGGGADDEPSASRSTIAAAPGSVQTNASSTITVTVLNAEGDPIEGAQVSLQVSGAAATVVQPSTSTGSNGVATGTVTATAPGTLTVSATVNGSTRLDQTADITATGTSSGVDHFVFRLQPHDMDVGERFRVEVAMVDKVGNVVDLSGILIYLALFEDGGQSPVNLRLSGNRFQSTEHGVAVFDDLAIDTEGRYRLRALSDQLPELGPHGPEPFLFSLAFRVH
jgi:hypothetical protein